MNLSEKEIEYLKVIHKAEEKGFPVTFYENDQEKVNEYRRKYGEIHDSLCYSNLFVGSLACGSGLQLTAKGKLEIDKALLKTENRKSEKRKFKFDIISAIIGAFITAIIGAIIAMLWK